MVFGGRILRNAGKWRRVASARSNGCADHRSELCSIGACFVSDAGILAKPNSESAGAALLNAREATDCEGHQCEGDFRRRNMYPSDSRGVQVGNFAGPAIRLNGWNSLHALFDTCGKRIYTQCRMRPSNTPDLAGRPSDGLLIRRSLVRAQVGEPNHQSLTVSGRYAGYIFIRRSGSTLFISRACRGVRQWARDPDWQSNLAANL